ncbi:reductase [Metarhizium robertsii ARSEF 23]|uniref:Reductase n=1 Tax=Metarhizium robertsii (strain ARSEF 23 / ATCC MYA-3075) TaxID=655844 RepID=E9FC02_METRA|nr:reductase [Metarhizium robertsii ARSEF 23]EFY94773.1 reductase [Metarhizium robertsii ARSEF 23]
MKMLILGGTKFAGLHTAREAVSKGHDVTLFNRGTRPPPAGVTSKLGDRLAPNGYASLAGLAFDVAIDTWSSDPAAVQSAVDALGPRVRHYIYISTISVYDFKRGAVPHDESTPSWDPGDTDVPYIRDKLAGEAIVSGAGPAHTLIRPGVILGPEEWVWRLPWWLLRMERGGRTLAPGPRASGLQFIDVRDLAAFTVLAAEKRLRGPYNAVSETGHVSFGDFLDAANRVAGGRAELCWLEAEKVVDAGVAPWVEMPLWLAPGDDAGVYSCDGRKARRAGLTVRPAGETIADTWAWVAELAERPGTAKVGLSPAKEKQVLDRYC